MQTLSCAFFGHREYNYWGYRDRLEEEIKCLIERGVTEFYSGNRGAFDRLCAHIVYDLQVEYPDVKNILVLSYLPDTKFKLPEWYDDAVYLLDKSVPPRYAISHTNRRLAQSVNYIIVGIDHKWGGAWSVYKYAKSKLYSTLNIINNESNYFYELVSQSEIDKIAEEYRDERDTTYLKIKDEIETHIAKRGIKKTNKSPKEYEHPVWVSVTQKNETIDF